MSKMDDCVAEMLKAKRPYLTDGGLETTLIFHDGLDLPEFAAFPLLQDDTGRNVLKRYFARYYTLAKNAGTGFVLDTPTWRASAGWGKKIGFDAAQMDAINRLSIDFARSLRDSWQVMQSPVVINGAVGPAGDGYVVDQIMSIDGAKAYHQAQISAFAEAGANMITAVTMNYANEAAGIALAAKEAGIPSAIAFTVETDGTLPSGEEMADAIAMVEAASDEAPIYYMINCAHPDHFARLTGMPEPWHARLGGLRANASRMSHEELDNAEELDDGDPEEFGALYADLMDKLPDLKVLGGCCGSDDRHVGCVAHRLLKDVA